MKTCHLSPSGSVEVSDYVKAQMDVVEMPRPLTAGFKAVLHAAWSKRCLNWDDESYIVLRYVP